MDKIVVKSPAKLNLYLDVLRKRSDGYHDIDTVFEKIALFDILTIKRRDKKGIKITTNQPKLPTGRTNLAYKAAKLLFSMVGYKGGVCVDIKKKIPISAGLGGGSSNAAATLLGINKLFKFGLKRKELVSIAKALGADVPLFLYDCSFAVGKERGDAIYPLDININIWHIIITFKFGVSTKSAYEGLNLRLTPPASNAKILIHLVSNKDCEGLGRSLYNKFEETLLTRYRTVDNAKRLLLKEGAYGAVLSGSGPTVFGITKTRKEAIGVERRIKKALGKGYKVLAANTFNYA